MYKQPGRLNAQENDIKKSSNLLENQNRIAKKEKQNSLQWFKKRKKKRMHLKYIVSERQWYIRCHCLQSFLVPQGAVFGNTYPSSCFPKKEKNKWNVLSHKYCILLGGTGYVHFNIEGPKVKLLTSYDEQFSSHYIKEKLKLEASVLSLAIFCFFSSHNGIHSDLTLLINIYATLAAIH